MAMRKVLVYGSRGALGQNVVTTFKGAKWDVLGVDLKDEKITPIGQTWTEQSNSVMEQVKVELGGEKIDAIINVAGGWAGGNIADEGIIDSSDLMWKQSVHSSIISGKIAVSHMNNNGLLVLPGAAAAAEGGTSFMMGYGMAKAAVHHLVKSLAQADSGLPEGAVTVGFLPVTIDTPMNREAMPDNHDVTPCDEFSSMFPFYSSLAEQQSFVLLFLRLVINSKQITLKQKNSWSGLFSLQKTVDCMFSKTFLRRQLFTSKSKVR